MAQDCHRRTIRQLGREQEEDTKGGGEAVSEISIDAELAGEEPSSHLMPRRKAFAAGPLILMSILCALHCNIS